MPPTVRERLRRDVAKVYVHCERGLQSLQLLDDAFQPDHPEYTAALQVMASGFVLIQQTLRTFWESAWGKCPDDIADWWDHHGDPNASSE